MPTRAFVPTAVCRATSIVLGFCASLAACGQRAVVSSIDTAEIRAQVQRYVATLNHGNPDALAELYLRSSEAASLGDGEIHTGWETIAALLRVMFESTGDLVMEVDTVMVTPLGSDAAIAFFPVRWSVGGPEPLDVTGAMTLVYVRTPRGWKVAHDHTSTLEAASAREASADRSRDQAAPRAGAGPARPRRATTECRVARIIDGDTIECSPLGRIRLIGIDAPEESQKPFGAAAAEALQSLVPVGSGVELERDVELRDRYGRLLGYLWADGRLVNWLMVREGWAVTLTYPPNVQYVEALRDAQRSAQAERRGLWAVDGFACLPRDHRQGRC